MTALALHAQRSVDAERGKLVGTHRPIFAHARRADDPAYSAPISIDELREQFLANFETGELFRRKNTRGAKAGDRVYVGTNTNGYARVAVRRHPKSKFATLHRVIWALAYGYWPDHPLDHIDRNPLNNRLSNLRACSLSQNSANRDTPTGRTSTYRGVSWHKSKSTWRAVIRVRGKDSHIGSFNNEIDAAKAYDSRALAEFGQFAVINFAAVR